MKTVQWADDFKKLYKENGQHPYVIRLLALSKMQEGYAIENIKPMVNKTAKTLLAWKRLYESGGLEALLSIKPGRGRKTKIDPNIIKEEIKTLGSTKKGGRVIAQEVRQMIKKEHNVDYSLPGIYHLLHRLNFSWISVRSIHPKVNLEEQETFKKNSIKM
jgi:transposase